MTTSLIKPTSMRSISLHTAKITEQSTEIILNGKKYQKHISKQWMFLISNFRRVLNVIFFLVGDSPASEFYMSTFRKSGVLRNFVLERGGFKKFS
jgi:gamma-glutamylcysteine synthetase